MDILVEIVRSTLSLLIIVLESAMFVRAIMSWFPIDDNKFTDFLYAITEPLILPIRILFEKLNIGTELPIDIPFLVTFVLLSLVGMFI